MSRRTKDSSGQMQDLFGQLPAGEDMDLSDEYFEEDDEEITEDYNPRLGRMFLRITLKQIEDREPDFVAKAWRILQRKGFYRKQARTLLTNAFVGEFFEMMQPGGAYRENRYRKSVDKMVADAGGIRPEDIPDRETGRERRISEALRDVDEEQMFGRHKKAAQGFSALWPELKAFVEDNYARETTGGLEFMSPEQIDDATDFRMDLANMLDEAGEIYLNAGMPEEGARILGEILDTFSWKAGDADVIRGTLGDLLEAAGKPEETDAMFARWMKEEPGSPNCAAEYALILNQRGATDRALEILDQHLPKEDSTDPEYEQLYRCAEKIYKKTGDEKKRWHYADLVEQIENEIDRQMMEDMENLPFGTDDFDDEDDDYDYTEEAFDDAGDDLTEEETFRKALRRMKAETPKPAPAPSTGSAPRTVPQKIYPNDPCPCGSGKKYKKCCGKK